MTAYRLRRKLKGKLREGGNWTIVIGDCRSKLTGQQTADSRKVHSVKELAGTERKRTGGRRSG